MAQQTRVSLALSERPVELHYPGAEGVSFTDALLVLRNEGDAAIGRPALQAKISQEGKALFDGLVDLAELGVADSLAPGEEARVSVFRLLQKEVQGFGSRINMFGYKASLNWGFQVSATAVDRVTTQAVSKTSGWNLLWRPQQGNPSVVEVDATPL